ncbi:MAG: hydrolase [Rhodospirillaceae bacterium]|nr:hydrolase [Rhodospirillaceae bacterium]|tara:strand:- start:16620 stop:17714 length:1095 start_codon:yes stop_codon:yes gene_type:complete
MDSVTQFTLGACVGVAVLGRKIGPRRAALTGGILGTLPDLDVYLAPDDPIDSFVEHRGWTHSLFVHAALTPVIGEAIRRLFRSLRDQPFQTYAAVFLCLSTHALLDAITVYGTRLFWPISPEPIALGSIFIIDPLYTLPLLVLMVWAFLVRSVTARLGKAVVICLGLSTAYLGWTAIGQIWMTQRAQDWLASYKISPDQLMAIPTPFNSFHWRVVGIDGDLYFNLYMPMFGGPETATLYTYPRHLDLKPCVDSSGRIAKVEKFSRGFYRVILDGDEVSVADLRMGLTPNYAFRFSLGQLKDGQFTTGPTIRREGRGDVSTDIDWLLANLQGKPVTRLAEAKVLADPKNYRNLKNKAANKIACRP